MAVRKYGNCLMMSRPTESRDRKTWHANASVTWADEDGSHDHEVPQLGESFATEASALVFGFMMARAWIDGAFQTSLLSVEQGEQTC
jgi:hypothetical protein